MQCARPVTLLTLIGKKLILFMRYFAVRPMLFLQFFFARAVRFLLFSLFFIFLHRVLYLSRVCIRTSATSSYCTVYREMRYKSQTCLTRLYLKSFTNLVCANIDFLQSKCNLSCIEDVFLSL